jgi:anti-sigma B factor antagonist
MPDPLEFQVESASDSLVIDVRGEIDMATVGDLQARAGRALDRVESRVVVDLEDVSFIDSSGLDALVRLHRSLIEQNRKLTIRGLSEVTRRPFEATQLIDVLDIE